MKLLKETRFGKAFGKKGLLITLGTCILAAGGVGLAAYNRTVDNIGESLNLALNDSNSITENVLADANDEKDILQQYEFMIDIAFVDDFGF